MEDFVLQFPTMFGNIGMNASKPILNYAQLLKQPPELWMFVPCDEDGKVMKEPGTAPIYTHSLEYIEKYKQAKQRCLFEGFEIIFQDNNSLIVRRNLVRISFRSNTKCVTFDLISDITKFNLPLSQNTINKIYL